MKTVVYFEHQTKGGPMFPHTYKDKSGKTKYFEIKHKTKTELDTKIRKLRKKLKLNNWWSTMYIYSFS